MEVVSWVVQVVRVMVSNSAEVGVFIMMIIVIVIVNMVLVKVESVII